MLEFVKKYICCLFLLLVCTYVNAQQKKVYDFENPLAIQDLSLLKNQPDDEYFYFEKKNANSARGRIIIDINTQNRENISVSWRNSFTKKIKNKWFVRLQYRLSENGEWKDVLDKRGKKIEYVTSNKRYAKTFDAIMLPEECNNRDFVQVSWLVDSYSKNKSNHPDIKFRDLSVNAVYDKYFGLPAKIDVSTAGQIEGQPLYNVIFNRIPLPYVFPEVKRILVKGENIRNGITVKITGKDASEFSVSTQQINADKNGEVISVNYNPKKEGFHKAILVLNTAKLVSPVEIPLEGACAKLTSFETNLLPEDTSYKNRLSYSIPVFSNTDYQYKFSRNKEDVQKVEITYKWYYNDSLLYVMSDTVNTDEYCIPLKSPEHATKLLIDMKASHSIRFNDCYLGSPAVKTMVKSGLWDDDDNWRPAGVPDAEDYVTIDEGITAKVTSDAACSMLILRDNANVNITNGKAFYVANDIIYGKNAWFAVHQYLLPVRWNYISSPVNQARAAIFSMKNLQQGNDTWLMQYNTGKRSKMDDYWSDYITDPEFTLRPGIGYAVYTHEATDVKYEGLLCNSTVNVPLVSTPEDRWNLIGNPYTAPLSSKKIFEDIDGKIQGNAIMLFDRQTKVYNPLIIDTKEDVPIPPLESFFAEALDKQDEITFKRSHQYTYDMSEIAYTNHNYLNLSVTKDGQWQYVLLGMDDRSGYGFDIYDCHKMFGNNENMPDIYLKDAQDEYSVCVFPDYPAVYDVGMYIGNDSDVEMDLNNLSVLPGYTAVFMEDKISREFYDLCNMGNIKVHLNKGTTERFRLHILKSYDIRGEGNYESGVFFWADKERLLFYCDMTDVKVERIKITQNGKIVFEGEYDAGQVMSYELKKGNYELHLFYGNKWQNVIKAEI